MPKLLRRWLQRARETRTSPDTAASTPLPAAARSPAAAPAAQAPAAQAPAAAAPAAGTRGRDAPVIAAGLTAFGLGPGSRIAVMGLDPHADCAAAEAITLLGAEPVVVPDHANGPRLRLRLRGVRAVLTRNTHVQQIAAVAGDLPDLQQLWSWDTGGREEIVAAAQGRMPAFQD